MLGARLADARPGAPTRARAGFRPELEGLRGVAVVLVVAFHARIAGFAGGFIGVDVFFVLSGWLITSHLLDEARTSGTVALRRFWARRVRRLVPALGVTVVGTLLVAAAVLSPLELARTARDATAAATYTSNLVFASDATDYFAPKVEESLFLHTWSLGVEEQFYLVWPLAVLAMARVARRRAGTIRTLAAVLFAATTLGSLGLAVALTATGTPWSFFGLPTRAWEFGAAGLLAAVGCRPGAGPSPGRARPGWIPALRPAGAAAAPIAGLAAIGWASLRYTAATPYPDIPTVLPVAGALAVIHWAGAADGAGRVLSLAPLRWLGRVSYSWYLWHWPVILLAVAATRSDDVVIRTAAAGVALGLAWATHTLVENPVRFSDRLLRTAPWRTFAVGGLATVLAVTAAASVRGYGEGQLDDPLMVRLHAAQENALADPPLCQPAETPAGDDYCVYGDAAGDRTVVLLGDSHALHWVPGLAYAAERLQVRLVEHAEGGCPPVDVPIADSPNRLVPSTGCARHRAATDRILAAERPDLVVLSMTEFDGRVLRPDGTRPSPDEQERIYGLGVDEVVRRLQSSGTRVTFVLDNPRPRDNPLTCVGRTRSVRICTPSAAEAMAPVDWLVDVERTVSAEAGLPAPFDTPALLCDPSMCRIDDGEIFFYSDEHHLSAAFVAAQTPALAAWLRTALA